LPGKIVKFFVPRSRYFDLSFVVGDDTIVIRILRACYFVPQSFHQLLDKFFALGTLTLRGGDITKGLKFAAFPDALLAALPLLIDGQRFNGGGVIHVSLG
jgi:hypothetical protein